LLEDVIKILLEELSVEYSKENDDIPRLYNKLAAVLNLSPKSHAEKAFKEILGGCFSAIQGLGTLRNKTGDEHGRGRKNYKPTRRQAELAVNISGGMVTFLIDTFENKKFLEKQL